ncbi:MAG TPA: CvpA family protein [Verrucomicrobiae bacterium]|nr:CvpA family protein [Verrucomicrobiae bacterium]
MIAAAVLKTSSWWHNLSFNWFDVALVLILAFGFWRGRKRGMSREALPTAFWLIAVVTAGLVYQPLGDMLQSTGYVKKIFGTSLNEHTTAYVICYLVLIIAVFSVYSMLAKHFREKVSGSNTFGSGEYYLGIIAGMIRYACITIFFLALLNAPYYSMAEIAAEKAYNNRWYGGGLNGYSGDFIPSLSEVQQAVFQNSVSGPAIKNSLGMLLIQSAAPGKPKSHAH